jgi:DNA mismatch endonuclease (patch repair protein)
MSLTRSEQMSRIRGRNTGPERWLRSLLWARGFRYRLHGAGLPGRPDLVFIGRRTAVFVDGCFWHGCPDHYVRPRTRTVFWAAKLQENVKRDQTQCQQLASMGWRVVRLWEHEVFATPQKALADVLRALHGRRQWRRPSWRVAVVEPLDHDGRWERRTLVSLHAPNQLRKERHRRHTRKWQRPGQKASGSAAGNAWKSSRPASNRSGVRPPSPRRRPLRHSSSARTIP